MNKHDETRDRIKAILTNEFSPTHLEVQNESHLHEGHAGAKSGGGHFRITIDSYCFKEKTRIQTHRLINHSLKALFETNKIHALSIQIKI